MKILNVNFFGIMILSLLLVMSCSEEEIVEPASENVLEETFVDSKNNPEGRKRKKCTPLTYNVGPRSAPDSVQMVQNHFAGSYINVYVNTSENWTGSIDQGWAFFFGAGSDSGSGSGSFTLMAPGGVPCTPRSATVTINAGCSGTRSFVVYQEPAPGQPCS